jgi:two-component system cell cycle sensor histidine kinase/response regulator CckA
VDAVVVAGGRGEQVYTRSGADRIYRQFIETMREGAVTVSAAGVILYCNARMAEMLRRPLGQVLGTPLRDHFPPADQWAVDGIPRQGATEASRREVSLLAGDGRQVPVYLSASLLPSEGDEWITLYVLTDLTEHKSYERIVAAERLARLILEQAAEVIIVCDNQGRVTRVSHAAQSLCVGSPLLKPFAEAFPLRTHGPAPFSLASVLQGEALRDVDVAMARNGEQVVLILNAGPLVSGQQILGCVITLTDITVRQRAEETLRTTGDYLESLIDHANAPIVVWDPGRRVTLFNHAFERMAGYLAAEVLGNDLAMLFPQGSRDESLAKIAATEAGGLWESVEIPIRCKSGEIRLALWNSANVHGPDGTSLQATIAQGQDITERKHAEEARERLTMAIEQSAESVVVTDAQGTIVYVNPAFESTTGYTRSEALGQNPRILKSGVQDATFYRALWETISGGKTWHGRLLNKTKDGKAFTEDASISPVRDARGVIASYVAVKRDISHDLELEAQLLQSQKMEGIGRLAGGIAHDFNNLLTVMLSYTGFALEGLVEGDERREDLLEVKRGAKRAAELTQQLLAFSRRQVLQPELLSLNRIAEGVEKMLRRTLGEDIDLVQTLAPDLGLIRADPGQIEQVLMNLVINARDSMPTGGKLTIQTANVEIDEQYAADHIAVEPGPYVQLTVTDSGCGMDHPTQARIFEPFFTTKPAGKGTGLGLSTVYGIVKQSAGNIWVYSEPGQGTTFKIYLPRAPLDTKAMEVRRPAAPICLTGTETILVVEDEEALRKVARRTLQAAGYTVLTASDGEDAIGELAKHGGEVHLLLTDVVMPRMGGRLLAQEVSKSQPAIKVLYMSGYTDEAIVHHGVLEPGVHFLAKPFVAVDLVRKVREVLDGDGSSLPLSTPPGSAPLRTP